MTPFLKTYFFRLKCLNWIVLILHFRQLFRILLQFDYSLQPQLMRDKDNPYDRKGSRWDSKAEKRNCLLRAIMKTCFY